MSILNHADTKTEPSSDEINQAASILSKLQPGFLPKEIFMEFTRLTVTPIIEIVPVRKSRKGTEVLLLKRPDDDPSWPGMLHTPGTVLRSTDIKNGVANAFDRIFNDELKITPTSVPIQSTVDFHKVKRGVEFATVFYLDLTNQETTVGQWYLYTSLPNTIVDTQIGFIQQSITNFEKEGKQ